MNVRGDFLGLLQVSVWAALYEYFIRPKLSLISAKTKSIQLKD